MIQEYINQPHWSCWPFWVLELTPNATLQDIEKAARDLTNKIEFGFDLAKKFETPQGEFERDSYLIREAKAKLQNPEQRLQAEFWYIEPSYIKESSETPRIDEGQWLNLMKVG